jgi:predicted nucleic acid-binding protein
LTGLQRVRETAKLGRRVKFTALFSEDMQDGLVIQNSLRIRNPFHRELPA